MTRGFSTSFGEPLSELSKKYVKEVRSRITQPISPIVRSKLDRFTVRYLAHLAWYASTVFQDSESVRTFDENPIFQKRLMPKGEILDVTDNKNRLLWYIEYATIAVEELACALQSSQVCKYQFWQFEYMLRRVMEQERKTGRLSSIRHIIDMTGYEINPFTMVFVTNGTLAYYSQLFHYENYPELVTPIDIVNIAKWIHVPYKLAKAMMPAGFSDRFRLHDNNFLKELTEDIGLEHIPTTLGGKDDVRPMKRIFLQLYVKFLIEHSMYWCSQAEPDGPQQGQPRNARSSGVLAHPSS
ncbi:unnamed protein product [Strongylus vulgaris]|uniref:CRAL-TRIO domain-containing protein n=1 Tax=Strongylus vulgaris TaxID=40348 RepID=A0A3P7IMK3_STRVU|nr:unnamed protein product [Strongylus vulgaris]